MANTYDSHEVKNIEIVSAYEDLAKTFEQFKETNDERILEIERRASNDPLIDEKLARIDQKMNDIQESARKVSVKSRRPFFTRKTGEDFQEREYKAAFERYLRRGETGGLKNLEEKTLTEATLSEGGYLVTSQVQERIDERLLFGSPMRSIASIQQVSSDSLKKTIADSGFEARWSSESSPIVPETQTSLFSEIVFKTFEVFAQPAATTSFLDDSFIDVETWLVDEIEQAFLQKENNAFVVGNGVNQPYGFVSAKGTSGTSISDKLDVYLSGKEGGFKDVGPLDPLFELIYGLPIKYRRNAVFVMNRKTQSEVRKLKDDSGRYVWTPQSQPGERPALLNFPVVEMEDMPDVAPDACAIAFGDFRRGYLVTDRTGTRILRDPYSHKPYVLFYTTKRVGGGVQDFSAIKLLQFSA